MAVLKLHLNWRIISRVWIALMYCCIEAARRRVNWMVPQNHIQVLHSWSCVHVMFRVVTHWCSFGKLIVDLLSWFFYSLQAGAGEQWRNETLLTLSLLNCISPRLPQASNFVSVSFISGDADILEFTPIQINYAVPNISTRLMCDIPCLITIALCLDSMARHSYNESRLTEEV